MKNFLYSLFIHRMFLPFRIVILAFLLFTLPFSFSVGEMWAEPYIASFGIQFEDDGGKWFKTGTKGGDGVHEVNFGSKTNFKILYIYANGNKNGGDLCGDNYFKYEVYGTTGTANWGGVNRSSCNWSGDVPTYKWGTENGSSAWLDLVNNRKPGEYRMEFLMSFNGNNSGSGCGSWYDCKYSGGNWKFYWTIPDPTISFTSNHTPVKGQPVTLSTSVSNWAYGMTIKSVTYKHNGTAISTKTTGDLSSTSYTHTPTVAGTGKYTVEVVCTYGSAGDVTYTESINVTDSYTVTYGSHTNGSFTIAVPNVSASSSSKNAASEQRVDISATGDTGYEFSAWDIYKTGTPATKVSTNSSDATTYFTMPAYAVTVDATFVGKYYDVTLDPDNGSSTSAIYPQYASSMPSTLKGGGALSAPVYTGYTFGGYYDERAGAGTQYYTNTMSSANNWNKASNTTLYAKWTPNTYTITLNPNGGTGSTASVEIDYGQTPPNTDAVNPYFDITNPTKPGYTFLGWFTAAGGGDLVINTNGTLNANVASYTSTSPGNIWIHPNNATLYAHWTPENIAQGKTAKSGWSRTDAASGGANSAEAASKAIDGNSSTQWVAWEVSTDERAWWGVDLGNVYSLTDFGTVWRSDGGAGDAPSHYLIQVASSLTEAPADFVDDSNYSNDGWITVTEVNETQSRGGNENHYIFNNYPVRARYVRLVSLPKCNIALSEFRLYSDGHSASELTPTITSAPTEADITAGSTTLTLTAQDHNGAPLHTFLLQDQTGKYYFVRTNESNQLTINGLDSKRYIMTVWATESGYRSASRTIIIGENTFSSSTNIALNKPAYAVIGDKAGEIKEYANDGILTNGWRSAEPVPEEERDNVWWYVDLMDAFELKSLALFWEGAYATGFIAQVRSDEPTLEQAGNDSEWRTFLEYTGEPNVGDQESNINLYGDVEGSVKAFSITPKGRYVRLRITDAHNWDWGVKLRELRIFGNRYLPFDNSVPTLTASYSGETLDRTGVIFNVSASDDQTSPVTDFMVVDHLGMQHNVTASDGTITVTDMPTGKNVDVTIYAFDASGNSSEGQVVNVSYVNPADNLALNKTCWSSGTANQALELAANANNGSITDGKAKYFWGAGDNAWWIVDLGDTYQLSSIECFFSNDKTPSAYKLYGRQNEPTEPQRSTNDGWVELAEKTSSINYGTTESDKNEHSISFTGAVRYVKFYATSSEIKLIELRVFGSNFLTPDYIAPVWNDPNCAITSAIGSTINMTLEATDSRDGAKYDFVINVSDGISDRDYKVSTTGVSNAITIADAEFISYCVSYTITAYCYDYVGNVATKEFNIIPSVPALTNLARGKTTAAGISENDDNGAFAVDGNTGNQWSGNASGRVDGVNQWMYVDLGKIYDLSSVKITWGAQEGSWPQDYELQASYNGTDFAPFVFRHAKDASRENTYSISGVSAQYVRVWANKSGTNYGMCISELEVYGDCHTDSENPVLLFAATEGVFGTFADIRVAAIDDVTPSYSLSYQVTYTVGGLDPVTISPEDLTDGVFRLTGLTATTSYTIQVTAIDASSNSSAYRELSFTTSSSNLSGLACSNSVNGWLTINGRVWTDATMNPWRFSATNIMGLYRLQHEVTENATWTFKLYDINNITIRGESDGHVTAMSGKDFVMTAKGVNAYISNYHPVFISGPAVGTDANDLTKPLTWENIDGHWYATWEGEITPNTIYHLIFTEPDAEGTANSTIRSNILTPAGGATYEGTARYVRLTFDLETWTCSFERLQNYVIYHHGQAPEGGVEAYAGGTIPQPIEYRRKFEKDTWYSIYFPFDVTAVQVIDDEDGLYYDLKPYYRSSNGVLHSRHYIIRKATPATNMDISKFESKIGESGWLDPEGKTKADVDSWLPEKNTPYMIQFHNDYYTDKWIAFIGAAGSTIATDFVLGDAPADSGFVNIYGNNTLHSTSLATRTYMINYDEYEGNAWTRFDEGTTLYPFEVYMRAEAKTTEQHQVLGRRPKQEDTATAVDDIYTETSCLRVYTLTGQLLLTLYHITPDDAGRQLQQQLGQGIYILHSDHSSYKLIIGGH